LTDEQIEEKCKHISYILTEVIKIEGITQEVMDGVKSGYYDDESIILKDLLNPEQSPIVLFKQNAATMQFAQVFQQTFNANVYMFAQNYANITYQQLLDFIQEDNVAIYFPYSDNFQGTEFPTLTYNTIKERDDNVGYASVISGGRIDSFTPVTVNDVYASTNATWVLKNRSRGNSKIEDPCDGCGGGGWESPVEVDSAVVTPCEFFQNPDKIYEIYVGHIRAIRHMDPFFGFNNSGGAEVIITRGHVIQNLNNQPSGDTKEVHLPKITRKQSKDKVWITVYRSYQTDWDPQDRQFVLGCYENDDKDPWTITGSAKLTVQIDSTTSLELSATATKEFKSVNGVQFQHELERCNYFKTAHIATNITGDGMGGLYEGWRRWVGKDCEFTLTYNIID
jgi:hypothetical protein